MREVTKVQRIISPMLAELGSQQDEIARLEAALAAKDAEIAKLREALAPFARIADMEERAGPADSVMVNVARCRDARVALNQGASDA